MPHPTTVQTTSLTTHTPTPTTDQVLNVYGLKLDGPKLMI